MSRPRWFQVLTEEDLNGYCKQHRCGFRKNIFRFESCDVVCLEGIDLHHIQPHVEVVTLFDVNGLHTEEISDIFDCSQIQVEHVLEHEGDLSSITKNWSEDDSRETFEHVGDLSIHPCGDPERIFPIKKRSRTREENYDSDEFERAFAYRPRGEPRGW